jgi:aspartyl-tRNA synthetase
MQVSSGGCRAEKSYTHRHLCEFTGLDFEMEIREHYFEVLDVIDALFRHIFEGLTHSFGACHIPGPVTT